MDAEAKQTKKAKKSSIPTIIVSIVLFMLIAIMLSPTILTLPVAMLFGWISYPLHIAPKFQGFSYGMAKGLLLFIGLVIGLRQMLLWGSKRDDAERKYSWKNCLLFTWMIIVTFLASMAAMGILHQAAWLSRDGLQVTNSSSIPFALATSRILHSPNEKDAWKHLQHTQRKWPEHQFIYIPNKKLPVVVIIPVPDGRHYPGTTAIKVYSKNGRYTFHELSAEEVVTSLKSGIMPPEK
ncbi:hypothetical protein [Candidatus Uabimicrobium amorphum]|uniref:Uncharacterized protein n=1 Tax=Uabimicrobium amorphum TaxID=2596890 RepID=A0A5S9F2I8_UABAM|nr:hypothetical protein [Candidatus Uabimicrobium amorphum]BBM82509.1 hypothetical protein UABAM_00852 [Candidatus Uabimicrobium amorphum]